MSLLPKDINDDEIRIISSERKDRKEILPTSEKINEQKSKDITPRHEHSGKKMPMLNYGRQETSVAKPKWKLWIIITAIIFFGGICVFFWWEVKDDPEETENLIYDSDQAGVNNLKMEGLETVSIPSSTKVASEKGFVETYDTIINKVPLTIFKPKNLTPKLHIGIDALRDSTASFVIQAADIRRDNGQIVGAYVSEGNLLSRGQSKAGFCAIINGNLIIGVADSTPYLEQAIETGGYFFRQYPLVVGGQIVENKLKSSSLRKALAELNGEIVVIMNDRKQTLNEFSQTLTDLGVTNAIYLIGSTAPGFAIDEDGNRIDFGKEYENPSVNSNYIIWQ